MWSNSLISCVIGSIFEIPSSSSSSSSSSSEVYSSLLSWLSALVTFLAVLSTSFDSIRCRFSSSSSLTAYLHKISNNIWALQDRNLIHTVRFVCSNFFRTSCFSSFFPKEVGRNSRKTSHSDSWSVPDVFLSPFLEGAALLLFPKDFGKKFARSSPYGDQTGKINFIIAHMWRSTTYEIWHGSDISVPKRSGLIIHFKFQVWDQTTCKTCRCLANRSSYAIDGNYK